MKVKSICWLLAVCLFCGCAHFPRIRESRSSRVMSGPQDLEIPAPESRLPEYEKLTYDVRWLGLYVGTLTTSVKGVENFKGRDAYVLEATMKTQGLVSKIFKMEDRFVSYMDAQKLYTLRHEVYRRDGNYKKDAITDFDQENRKAYFKNFIDKSEKSFDIVAGVHDILTACYYFMLLPLKIGEKIEYSVCNNEKTYQFFGLIPSKAFIKLPALGKEEMEAFLVQPYAKLKGEKVDKGNVEAYFSCDKRRIPLFAVLKGPVFSEITITLTKIENK